MRFFFQLLLWAVLPLSQTLAQVLQDNFTDGDFTANPTWQGNTADFTVNGSNQLQLNMLGTAATSQLVVPANIQDSTQWEFWVNMTFAPSSGNFSRIYLQSNSADLTASLNGYYLLIGETGSLDALKIYRQTGSTSTLVAQGTDAMVATNPNVRVRITRNALGQWTIEADYTGGTTFVVDGTGTDNTYMSGSFFGVRCTYTSTNGNKFFYDDFRISPLFVDVVAPDLLSATATSATNVDALFNEPLDATSAQNIANYNLTGGVTVSAATLDGGNPALVHLTVSTMTSATTYTLTVNNIDDINNNTLTTDNTAFTYYDIQPAVFGDIIINEIMADPNPVVQLPDAEYVELHNRSNKAIDLTGYEFNDGSAKVLPAFVLLPGAYVILCSNSFVGNFQPYGDVIGLSSLSLTNGGELLQLKDASANAIDSVRFDLAWYQDAAKDDGGWSLELINPNLACVGAANWIASNDTTGGTPGTENSVYNNTPDTQAPSVVSIEALSGTEIVLVFDETLDAIEAANTANYSISGFSISQAVFQYPATVTLTISPAMTDQTTYTVNIQNLSDCTGNQTNTNAQITYYQVQPAVYGDLLIYEIFADPTPIVGLPDGEFVEIHNVSNKAIKIENYVFDDGSAHTLPNFILLPDEYVILCTSTYLSAYQAFGNALDVSISLTNAGELLALYDDNGVLIDSVTYDDSWYQSTTKDDGGWSLEMINPAHKCQGAQNWIASSAAAGGTPGSQNSVYDPTLDNTAPALVEIRQNTATEIYLRFDEVMDISTLINSANFGINNGLSITGVNLVSGTAIVLTLSGSMTNNTTYTVSITGVEDCIGNPLNTNADLTYYEFENAEHYDILINEIYPDYNPTIGLPEKEFVELYNRSNKTINLQGFTFNDGSTIAATLPFYILLPQSYVVIYDNGDSIGYTAFGNVLPVANFPDLNVSGDDLVLYAANGDVVDAVSYEPSWFGNSDKSEGGWTLERINPNRPCEGNSNWQASINLLGGTPAQPNSVLQTDADAQMPDIWSAYPFALDSIRLFFSESMSDTAAINVANYSIDNGISVVEAYIEPPFYNTIVIITNADLVPGTTYTLTLQSGLTDCVGNIMSSNRTVQFALPDAIEVGDIIINEVLFNPLSGGSDFVELYNNSNKVLNIGDLIFANTDETGMVDQTENIETDWLLFPQQYVVITEEPSNVKTNYICQNPLNFIQNDLPTYPDDTGNVIIFVPQDTNSIIIDRFDYSETQHTPLIDDENGVSLERIDFAAPTNARDNWHSAATAVGYATPTYQNSSFRTNDIGDDGVIILPDNVFSPDNDGFEDFLLINYNVDALGFVANLHIYDAQGHRIRQLKNAELLMTEGTMMWDGAMDNGKKAPIGMYILHIELYNPDGTVKRYKKTCVVAGRI